MRVNENESEMSRDQCIHGIEIKATRLHHEQIIRALELTRQFRRLPHPTGSRVLGAHFYGPYFRYEARGAHPGAGIRPAVQKEFMEYLSFSDDLVAATVAPEIEGAKEFALACRDRGVRTNAGHVVECANHVIHSLDA